MFIRLKIAGAHLIYECGDSTKTVALKLEETLVSMSRAQFAERAGRSVAAV